MLYTIGHTASYESGLKEREAEGKSLRKLGRQGGYRGGIVFYTKEKAQSYLELRNMQYSYSVYGLDTTEDNLHEFLGQTYLIDDCPIVRL